MESKGKKKSISCSQQCNQFYATKNNIYEMYKPKKTTNFATQIFSYYSWSADARATDELTSGIARRSCAPSLDSVLAPKIQKRNIFGKGVSNLRACLD